MSGIERTPDGRIKIVFPPQPEPDPDPVFVCMMCGETVQQWKMFIEADFCNECLRSLRHARVRRDFNETTFKSDYALDFARDLIATIDHETTRHGF